MQAESYKQYAPLSKNPDCDSYVSNEMFLAQEKGKATLPLSIVQRYDDWVAEKLSITKEKLWQYFSSEQIDAIGIAIYKIEQNLGLIIADETGKGKGRILAGIARYALNNGKQVMFFTERQHLFSDFWRDLTHTEALELCGDPLIYHGKSTVYDVQGNPIYKMNRSKLSKITEEDLKTHKLILSTYSQVGLLSTKKKKLEQLLPLAKNSIIILDESHNAAGKSNTKKFMEALIAKSFGCIYSSATFIKDESELKLYQKAINFDNNDIKIFSQVLAQEENYLLRKYLTYELTERLSFWRREHKPENVKWEYITVEEEYSTYLNNYAILIDNLFNTLNLLKKEPALQEKLQNLNVWYQNGATISRLSRNLIVLLKLEETIRQVKNSLQQNHKSVIVIDSTFNSIINKVIDYLNNKQIVIEEEKDDEGEEDLIEIKESSYEINFGKVLEWLSQEIVGQYLNNDIQNPEINEKWVEIKEICSTFNELPISPIDYIIQNLGKEGISCGEISGRTFYVQYGENGLSTVKNIPDVARTKIVNDFNNGNTNVIILTRAGASGLSLHAGKEFKDQRVRDLYELEITNRTTYRLQFVGRVRRKNQVVEPNFFTIVTSLPFEQRIVSAENAKLKKMQSHISGDEKKMSSQDITNFFTPEADKIAKHFLYDNRDIAYKLGISLKNNQDDYYYIDSILKRCITLLPHYQQKILHYITEGIKAQLLINSNNLTENTLNINIDGIKTWWHNLNKTEQDSMKLFTQTNNKTAILNKFDWDWCGIVQAHSHYHINKIEASQLQTILQQNIEKYDFHSKMHFVEKFYKKQFINNPDVIEHTKTIQKNIKNIFNIQLGTYIKFTSNYEKVYGYIEDIIVPKDDFLLGYPTHYLFNIRTINPQINPSVGFVLPNVYITLEQILLSEDLQVYNNTNIDWAKFERNEGEIKKTHYFFMGHPIWIHKMKQAYETGESKIININAKDYLAIKLPDNTNNEILSKLRKPVFDISQQMDHLLIGKTLHSSCNNILEDGVKVMRKNNLCLLFVHRSFLYDQEFFDFPLKKKLGYGKNNGEYKVFEIHIKDLRTILYMLEKRELQLFVAN